MVRRLALGLIALSALALGTFAVKARASDTYLFDITAAGSSVNNCSIPKPMGAAGSWSMWCSAAVNVNTHCVDFTCPGVCTASATQNIPLVANQVYVFQQAPNESGIAIIGTATCHVAAHYPPQ